MGKPESLIMTEEARAQLREALIDTRKRLRSPTLTVDGLARIVLNLVSIIDDIISRLP